MKTFHEAIVGRAPALYRPAPPPEIGTRKMQSMKEELPDSPIVSLEEFIRDGAWQFFHANSPLNWGRHNREIADLIQKVALGEEHEGEVLKNLAVNVPPGSMKSFMFNVFWPAWEWHIHPWIDWLYCTHNGKIAKRDSVRTSELITSEWYQTQFGDGFKLVEDNKTYIRTNFNGRRMITTPNSGITGERADRLVVDDIIAAKAAYSKTKRENANTFFFEEFSNRTNSKDAVTVAIGQRLHEQDIFGELRNRGGWKWVVLPTRYHPTRFENDPDDPRDFVIHDWRKKPGEFLQRERFGPEEDKKERKNLGVYGYAGQHDQLPTPPKGAILKGAWMEYRWLALPSGPVEYAQFWDLKSGSMAEDSSRAVGQLWARFQIFPGRIYLIDQVKGLWDIEDELAKIKWAAKAPMWERASTKLVEDKADGMAVIRMLRDQIPGLRAFRVSGRGSKSSRYRAVAPYWQAGNIWLPDETKILHAEPWIDEFIGEHTTAPASAFDDQIDCSTMAIMYYFLGDAREDQETEDTWEGWYDEY